MSEKYYEILENLIQAGFTKAQSEAYIAREMPWLLDDNVKNFACHNRKVLKFYSSKYGEIYEFCK